MLATQGTQRTRMLSLSPSRPKLIAKLTPWPSRSQRIRRGHHRQITSPPPCGPDPYAYARRRLHTLAITRHHRLSLLPGLLLKYQTIRRALHHHNHLPPSHQPCSRIDDARAPNHYCFALSRSRRRHAAGGRGAGGAAPGRGEAVGAGDEPRGGGRVGQGAGDRAEAGGDARHAARPPRGRVRALPHRPRRQDRRGRGQRLCGRGAAPGREEGGEPQPEPLGSGRAVRVRRAGRAAAAAGEDDGEEGLRLREAARGRRQRERERERPPEQQRRRPAQLLHAALLHPQLHRAAPRPHPILLQLRPGRQRRRPRRLQQEGERRRHGQVLAAAVGPAVAQVEPAAAGPGLRDVRRAVGDADGGGPLCSRGQSLKTFIFLVR